MRVSGFAALLLYICLVSGPVRAQPSPESIVVFISVSVTDPFTQGRKELGEGSGFLIDLSGHILTAKHIVRPESLPAGPPSISVSLRDRHARPVPAQEVACEAGEIDLCLIKIPNASVSAANITFRPLLQCRELRPGEQIVAWGYPTGRQLHRVRGDIGSNISQDLKYQSDVQIVPGMSGGPVMSHGNRIVAVNTGGAAGFPTFTFLQPLSYGRPLLDRAGVECKTDNLSDIFDPPVLRLGMTTREFRQANAARILSDARETGRTVYNANTVLFGLSGTARYGFDENGLLSWMVLASVCSRERRHFPPESSRPWRHFRDIAHDEAVDCATVFPLEDKLKARFGDPVESSGLTYESGKLPSKEEICQDMRTVGGECGSIEVHRQLGTWKFLAADRETPITLRIRLLEYNVKVQGPGQQIARYYRERYLAEITIAAPWSAAPPKKDVYGFKLWPYLADP
jgi:trypsin-like peptidase